MLKTIKRVIGKVKGTVVYADDIIACEHYFSFTRRVTVNLEEFQSIVVASKERIHILFKKWMALKVGSISKELKHHFLLKHKLYQYKRFIFMKKQLVVPKILRKTMMEKIHYSSPK